jgi:hypothetical protein
VNIQLIEVEVMQPFHSAIDEPGTGTAYHTQPVYVTRVEICIPVAVHIFYICVLYDSANFIGLDVPLLTIQIYSH